MLACAVTPLACRAAAGVPPRTPLRRRAVLPRSVVRRQTTGAGGGDAPDTSKEGPPPTESEREHPAPGSAGPPKAGGAPSEGLRGVEAHGAVEAGRPATASEQGIGAAAGTPAAGDKAGGGEGATAEAELALSTQGPEQDYTAIPIERREAHFYHGEGVGRREEVRPHHQEGHPPAGEQKHE